MESLNMAMSPQEIQQEIAARGLSLAKIGRRGRPKISGTTIWRQIHRIPGGRSSRAMRLIASAIERTPEEVFGEAA